MSKEALPQTSPLLTKEEVTNKVFSEEGREKLVATFPDLERGEIDQALEEMIPVTESATIFKFIPSLVEGSLRKTSSKKKGDQ